MYKKYVLTSPSVHLKTPLGMSCKISNRGSTSFVGNWWPYLRV